ncbi:Uncharacterized protein TPAR_08361 [Tolypocladium paradoxum]|uniref:Secreted protein n=1 Tax=Tolypocladium paradoxum TaxID=94208 RepID=A0A2S4KMK5_9HYPO|nr:Uncharacterized protein TPAR_08361 [Tolypocladium paradoxum]
MLSLLLYGLLAVVRAAPSQADVDDVDGPGIPGTTVSPIFWHVRAFPDGPTLTLNGTLQEMHKRLLEINPNYEADFNRTAVATRSLEARTDFTGAEYNCLTQVWGSVNKKGYDEAVPYLQKHDGTPHMLPGPRVCGRVSCSYNTAVWMCNDATDDQYLINWSSVADGIQYIWSKCAPDPYLNPSGGQVFHYTNWNVVLRDASC